MRHTLVGALRVTSACLQLCEQLYVADMEGADVQSSEVRPRDALAFLFLWKECSASDVSRFSEIRYAKCIPSLHPMQMRPVLEISSARLLIYPDLGILP